MLSKAGKSLYFLMNCQPRTGLRGEIVSVGGIATDITYVKNREVEIERVIVEAQNFIDTANAPIFTLDQHLVIVDWNRKASELSAFPREEVQGLPLLDLIE